MSAMYRFPTDVWIHVERAVYRDSPVVMPAEKDEEFKYFKTAFGSGVKINDDPD